MKKQNTQMTDTSILTREFETRYGKKPEKIFFCPGRVNLIGEHIDYNGGSVMPCAISRGTYLCISGNTDKVFRFECLNFPETATLHLQGSYTKSGGQWFNYPLGVINELLSGGHNMSGLDFLFYGNLPVGAGLSSSASIEVLTAFAITSHFGISLSRTDIALLAKKVENQFIGVNCGIMDQFAVAMGKDDQAILLNCDTLEYEYLPFKTGDYELVVINTNKPRKLAESKYNERFDECMTALKLFQQKLNIGCLCDLSPLTFEQNQFVLNTELLKKRAWHVVTEHQRVKDAALALQAGDMETFGKLMFASHQSLKDNYEVTGAELDCIVDFCYSFTGCIGARMTGAGFGGCAIALVHRQQVHYFEEKLVPFYFNQTGYTPEIFVASISGGATDISS